MNDKQYVKCCQIEQRWTKGRRLSENLNESISPLSLSLPGTLKRQSLKDVTFHTPSHTWNTQRLMHYSWLQWVNEKDAALSIQEPFPAVMLWVKEENKSPWCSFYTRRQSDVNFFFNERSDKVVWQAILIKARWPQQGAAAPQHMRDVPQFSQQHMYGCICVCVCVFVWVWVCDINASVTYFHHAFSGGALTGIGWK